MTLALLLLLAAAPHPGVESALSGLDATIVIHDRAADTTIRRDAERAARRFSPCSTFKIPNTLIALETGVVTDASTTLAFDPAKHPRRPHDSDARWKEIAHDHSLRSAFRESIVWYYRDVAVRVGGARMQGWLDAFDYGNRDMSAGVDGFWLGRSLAISADEQIRFLEKVQDGAGLAPRSLAVLRDVMEADRGPGWVLFAKTGSGELPGGRKLGWYVGWVEREGRTFTFAFNMEAADWDTVFRERIPRARAALVAAGALPGR